MKCARCSNEDPRYFYQDDKVFYCRKCVQFGRLDVGEKIIPKTYMCKKHRVKAHLDFELSDAQKEASSRLKDYALAKKDTLVYACCGAGKTEICFEVITAFLNNSKKVGFAISRRQVVLEIASRLKHAYPSLKVIAVCQGHTQIDDGDLIVCTMHQLYRYHQTFDLLIMDEVDAFPYKNNEVLEAIAMNACKGVKIYLTATPSKNMLSDVQNKKLEIVELFTRPHGFPLVEPKIRRVPFYFLHMLCVIYPRIHEPWLVFVPTIEQAKRYARIFSKVIPCSFFTSTTENKEEILERFRKKELNLLFTSTILERGVTFQGVNVIVLHSDHPVFDEASLIQIAGRVGRSRQQPSGIVLFYAKEISLDMKRCVRAIRKMNESL